MVTDIDDVATSFKWVRSDLFAVLSGLASWIALACSLGAGAFDLYAAPNALATALLLIAILLAAVAARRLTRYMYSRDPFSLPLMSGFLGASLLATVLVLTFLWIVRAAA